MKKNKKYFNFYLQRKSDDIELCYCDHPNLKHDVNVVILSKVGQDIAEIVLEETLKWLRKSPDILKNLKERE